MVSQWWLLAIAVVWLGSLIYIRKTAYNHGIWDGAFNHFLPHVRKQMLYYNEAEAKRIFEAEKQRFDLEE